MAEHSGFQKLVAEAKKHITEISPQDAAAKLNSGDAIVVDVRDKDEWDEGHIPGATHMSRGTIELDIEEKVPDPNATVICHCGGGGRSVDPGRDPALGVVIAAAAAAPHLPRRPCKKWATKTSTRWPAA